MRQLEALKNAAAKGRLAHAYLLSGNDEAAKNSLIEGLVRFLAGSLPSKVHADVSIVAPENNEIGIAQIRALKERLSQSAWNSSCKIAVVRSADRMTLHAQSALLKLLEEPKGDTLIVLETSHAFLLLDTIRSRTQELVLHAFWQKPLTQKGLLAKLQKASLAERFAFAEKASKDKKALYETLLDLQREARLQLLEDLKEKRTSSLALVRLLQEVLAALRGTQVNLRLAAERVLLEL